MQLGISNVSNFAFCWNKNKKYAYNAYISFLMTLERFTELNQKITMISKKDIINNKLKRDCKTISYLETLFISIYSRGVHLAIDEGMMPFKGKMKNRVYNPLKPDKWGMKFYIFAESTTGYVLNLRICGETASIEKTVTELTNKYNGENRKLYMDNFYNSLGLPTKLLESSIYVCGTLQDRRKGPEKLNIIKKTVKLSKSKHFLNN